MTGPVQHILVVDDNRDLAENVAELFATETRHTLVASSGEEACRRAVEAPFDLAVVDLMLPDTTGVELTAKLKEIQGDAEVILMTANASLDSAVAAVRRGAYAYVEKPFDPQELLAMGERALDQVRLRGERGRLQVELAHSEALYRGVVDSVNSFIVGLDPQGQVRMWNSCASQATGLDATDAVGTSFAKMLTSAPARAQFQQALSTALGGRTPSELELPVQGRHGARLVRWTLSRLDGAGQSGDLVLAVGVDMTDRLELEGRAAEAEAMASLGTLTAGLAHEIRNPLNAATLQLELLDRNARRVEQPDLRGKLESRVGIVKEELVRLTNLLNDFLNLARPKALEVEPVELAGLIDEVASLQEPAVQSMGLRLHKESSPVAAVAMGERAMLKQVLMNLVVNAVDALRSRGAGNIVLGCHEQGDERVVLFVRDDGPGIPEEVLGRLFMPFVTSKEAGTGLGLTIVKRIVERHGGSISAGPAPEGGTLVTVALPRART